MSVLIYCLFQLAFFVGVCCSFHPLRPLTDYPTGTPRQTALFSDKHVVVVGGGIGGLAVASRIAASSRRSNDRNISRCKVTILEKNSYVGGRCGSFDRQVDNVGIFRHERGPSLLLLPDVYRSLFEDCANLDAEKFGLIMRQCVPAYKVVFDDGDSIEVGFPRQPTEELRDAERQSRNKMDEYESDGAKKWDEYMEATSAFLDAGLPNFIEERLDLVSLPNFLREALRDFAKAWPLKPHSEVLDAIFRSDKMKALASFQDLYVGLEPYRNDALVGGGVLKSTAPAVFGLLAAIELHPSNKKSGVFAPVGGFQSVTDAVERLAEELGVEVRCNTMVTSIRRDGVFVTDDESLSSSSDLIGTTSRCPNNKFVPADLIVVNADLPYATKSLLSDEVDSSNESAPSKGRPPTFDWDEQFTFSSGVISFHWSIGKKLDYLNTHNVFMVAGSRAQAEASWEILRTKQGDVQTDGSAFNFYVHRASLTDPTAAPEGCDSIMVLVPCRTLLRDEKCALLPRDEALRRYKEQFSESTIAQVRAAVLARLSAVESLQSLDQWIVDEVVDTPATWAEQFHLAAGTPFALSHGFSQLSLTRPSHECRENSNVLFCGASTRPGNGVPLVLIGADLVSKKAIRRLAATPAANPNANATTGNTAIR